MSILSSYLSTRNGIVSKTTVKTADGETFVLDGSMKKYTPEEALRVAEQTFKTTVKYPKGEINGTTFRPRDVITGAAEVCGIVALVCGVKKDSEKTEPKDKTRKPRKSRKTKISEKTKTDDTPSPNEGGNPQVLPAIAS